MGIVEVPQQHPLQPASGPSPQRSERHVTHHQQQDLSDVAPDLPCGPLDTVRSQASFNWKQLKVFLEEPESIKIKMHVWKTLAADPLFAHPKVTPSVEEQKRLTQVQLRKLYHLGLVPLEVHNLAYKKKTKYMMTLNAALASWNKHLSVKFALGVSLFTNALLSLGTERHLHFYDAAWEGQNFFALGMTEVGHGSNTKQVRTTATYDPTTKEFVIHTPDFEAAKCWAGNLGKTCTHALLFAQLMTGGSCHGLHAFIVPIRDPETLLPYPGIKVGDIGEKLGLNGIDNGFVMFNHYRIPKDYLMNRTGDVTDDGEYESCFQNPEQIVGAALENLSAGRVAITQESTNDLCVAVTISVRYAAVRKQGSPRGSKDELLIMEYPLHQWRLFPYVAAACVFKVFVSEFTDQYLGCVEQSYKGGEMKDLSSMAGEVHAMVSAMKPLVTWTCAAAIQESREACGGFGFLKASALGPMRADHDATVTYEGDNNVLLQQTSNWLVNRWDDVKKGNTNEVLDSTPLNSVRFLVQADRVLKRRFNGSNISDVANPEFVKNAYEWLICWLLKSLDEQLLKRKRAGVDRFIARAETQAFYAKPLSLIYGENNALTYFWEKVKTSPMSIEMRTVMERLCVLYGLWCLLKHTVIFYQGGFSHGPEMAELMKEACQALCSQLKPDIVAVVDAISLPDITLNSILGKSDGKIYERLEESFMSQPGLMERPSWWHEVATKLPSKL